MTHRPLLPTYPEYKPSGLPWMGDIPAHWEVAAVKWNYATQLGKMLQNEPKNPADVETPYLKAQHVQWFSVRTTDAPTMWASPRDIEHFGIRKGDLLVCEGGEGGRSAIVGDVPPGCIIQNALHRVRPRGNCRNDYLLYVMSEIGRAGWFKAINNAVTIPHFTVQKFRSLKVPIPPIEEQAAIARYLTHKDALIQRFLQGKRRMLDLLKQLRKSTIYYTVKDGLNPDNTPTKPSGIPWLGDIPAHWKAIPLKYVATTIMGQSPPSSDCSDKPIGLPFLQGCAEFGAHHPTPVQYCRKPPKTTPPGAILLSVRAPVGRLNMADQEYGIGRGLCAIIPKNDILDTTLARYQLEALQHGLKLASTGSIYDAVRLRDVRRQRLLLPPLEEQAAIAEYLDDRIAKIDAAIAGTSRLIDLMEQYRKSLIHELVTGARDVRKAAAAIPDDPAP